MKLSIVGGPVAERFGERRALEMIKAAGFDNVDYSLNTSSDKTYMLGDDYLDRARETKKILSELSLGCYQTHAPFNFKYTDKMNLDNKAYRDVVRAIEYSSIIGAQVIVVHAIRVPADCDFLSFNLDYYRSLMPYGEKFGIKIAVENLVGSTFWTPDRLCSFIKMLDSDVFVACVDVGHSAIVGRPPEKYIEGMDKGILKCVHLHDTDLKEDKHWIPYLGNQNWDNIAKALKEYGFDGDVELEIIHSYDNLDYELMPCALEFAQKVGRHIIKKIKGDI